MAVLVPLATSMLSPPRKFSAYATGWEKSCLGLVVPGFDLKMMLFDNSV